LVLITLRFFLIARYVMEDDTLESAGAEVTIIFAFAFDK
jgi:hypothetical protein